jgi:hypothetical protein
VVFKNKFEHDIPLTFIISSIIMYVSLYTFKNIYVGLVLNILICLIFPIYLIKNKYSFKDIKDKYLTNGVICFLVLYLIVYLYDLNRFFTRWDELSHWGKMVKEIFRLNNFYSVNESHLLVHKDYPPMFSLMETMFTFISAGFKETYLIRCIHLFEGSIIISCIKNNKKIEIKKDIFKTTLAFAFLFIITLMMDSQIFINTIYIDIPISFIVGWILFNIFKERKYDLLFYVKLSLVLIFLLLSKQICISFYLIVLFFLGISLLFKLKEIKVINNIVKYALFVVLIPIIFLYSWNSYKSSLGLVGQFELSDIHVSDAIGICNGTSGEEWQITAKNNYFRFLKIKNISSSYFNITYLSLFFIIGIFSIIIYFILRNKIDKTKYKILNVSFILGYIGFIVMMFLLYVFSFGPYEGPALASYDRYMSTYILIVLYAISFIYIYYKDINYKKIILITFILMCLIKPRQYLRLRPDLILFKNHKFDPYIAASNLIDKYAELDDKVFIVDQKEMDGAVFYINYFSNKVTTNLVNYEKEPIGDIINDYKYVYTFSLNETSSFEEHTLYKIENNNLVKIEGN